MKGWNIDHLADITLKITDGSHNPPKGILQSDYLMLSSKNVFDDKLHYDKPRFLSADDFSKENKRTAIVPGDVLLTIVGTVGRSAVVPNDAPKMTLQRSVAVVRPRVELIEPRFLMYLFISRSQELNDQARGVAQKGIYLKSLRNVKVEYPSLSEQQRIVGILDEAFESIDKAKEKIGKILANVQYMFESYLQSVFTQKNDKWAEKKLGDACSIARGGSPRPIKQFLTMDPGGINWIKIGDATSSGKYIYTTKEKIIPEGAKRSRVVQDGDFILSNSMSFGRPYIMRTNGCIHDGWLVLSDYASHLDQDYLYYVLGSQFIFQQFDRLAAGSTVRNLNIGLASKVNLPVPPLKQQREIAQQFDELSTETQRLESIYQQKIIALDELKQSLLHQAFAGEL